MKFIVTISENTVLASNFTPEAMFGALEQTSSLIADYQGEGKIESFSSFADAHGGIMVVDVASHVELFSLVESFPARAFCDIESRPVISFEEWRGMMAKMREQMPSS